MEPRRSILDPQFRYTNAVETDLAKTFARIRRDMAKAQAAADAQRAATDAKVSDIKPKVRMA